ncbi:MAG: hypothetical protein DI637_05085 [Citromicrobium sp.]|nr:MAG: hypothetical protein DI637_05085 [Citromicrobium sp.]
MSFMDPATAADLHAKMSSDPTELLRLYRAKSLKFHTKSVDHSLVDDYKKEGWEEFGKPLKTKTKIRIAKQHNVQFEDDLWCQFYDLGYRLLNVAEDFRIPFSKDSNDRKQIDLVAVNDDSVLLVECKSAEHSTKAQSYKTEFEALARRLDGYKKACDQLFGQGKRLKYIFATRNIRLSKTSADVERLESTGSLYFNDNTFDYVNGLLKSYKDAANFQFAGLLFKGQSITKEKIELPAIEGRMGDKTYYMFSIEPSLLLKLGFVLHRTRANEAEMPTYQRLLVPSRLKGISKFIEDGGYFPNSVILNFNTRGKGIEFQGHSRGDATRSRTGIVKIPNTYAIAYIIDGQHRIYGYAGTRYRDSNTIPVVAFVDLEASEQLGLFMDINENQKAVSPTLRITLEEDLYWDAPRLDSRMKALRSSIIRTLGGDQSGPLFGRISLGEDRAELQARPFAESLLRCGLLPEARGNSFKEGTVETSLYDPTNHDHLKEMEKTRTRIVDYINLCYEYAEEQFGSNRNALQDFIFSNRGTYAFIGLMGSLNSFAIDSSNITKKSNSEDRFDAIKPFLRSLFKQLKEQSKEESDRLLEKLGGGADIIWLRSFQALINAKHPAYQPPELIDWQERQDQELQDRGRSLGTEIERHLKKYIIHQLKTLFDDNWDIEIGSIQRDCEMRAKELEEKRYKEGLGRVSIDWTEQFFISDYKRIIEKYWTKSPEESPDNFQTFEKHFSIDVGYGSNSKDEKLKWISLFSTLRNLWAHEGSKEKGLNREEVLLLEKIHDELGLSAD